MTDTLASKIVKASRAVGGALAVDKRNQEQRYDYISADKILTVAGQALADAGVMVLPSISTEQTDLVEYSRNGKDYRRYDATVWFLFTITDGESKLEAGWLGRGSDFSASDKALYKAITSGHKYFLMKLLTIGAGNEDGEHEDAEPKLTRQPAPQEYAPPMPDEPLAQQTAIVYPEMLCTFTSGGTGQRYVDMASQDLADHTIGIGKALKTTKDAEKQAVLQAKLDAIKQILAIRNQGK